MRLMGIHHLAIQVRELDRMVGFYRDLLGLPEQARHHRPDGSLRSVWLTLPGPQPSFLALEACSDEPAIEDFKCERPGLHLLAFRIPPEDRARIEELLARQGFPVVHQSRWTLYLRDPEGNRIGLSHHPDEPVPALSLK